MHKHPCLYSMVQIQTEEHMECRDMQQRNEQTARVPQLSLAWRWWRSEGMALQAGELYEQGHGGQGSMKSSGSMRGRGWWQGHGSGQAGCDVIVKPERHGEAV